MPILLPEDLALPLPTMYRVRQKFSDMRLEDVEGEILRQMSKPQIQQKIKPGQRIAVAVGSRGIKNLFPIVQGVVESLKAAGASPFIVSAMGSHGGACAQGQRQVLEGYGITQEALGVPMEIGMETVELGRTPKGIPVHFDAAAYGADGIVVINRVKLHTDFVGALQSGLCKMMVIGMGNHQGCSAIHEEDPAEFAQILEDAATIIMERAPISLGVAIMENAFDQTLSVEVVPVEDILRREKELVKLTVENMPFIRIQSTDVLVCEEIGKDVSGAGFDPNILGRSTVLTEQRLHVPDFQKMVLLSMTPASHGNGIGVGLFDIVTREVADHLSLEEMYANAIACKCIDDVKIPLTVEDEEQAIRVAVKVCRDVDRDKLKIVKIKNTLELEYIQVSEALLDEVRENPMLELA